MSFSEFLHSRRADAKALVAALMKTYDYASVLGVDVKARSVMANNKLSNISSGMDTECGFVVRVAGDGVFYEYSLDDIHGDLTALVAEINKSFRFSKALKARPIGVCDLKDEPLVQSFCRPSDIENYSEQQILDYCKNLRDTVNGKSENLRNVSVSIHTMQTSKLFISPNRELDQNYSWINGFVAVVYQENGRTIQQRAGENEASLALVMEKLPGVQLIINEDDFELDDDTIEEAGKNKLTRQMVEELYAIREMAEDMEDDGDVDFEGNPADRKYYVHFNSAPTEVLGEDGYPIQEYTIHIEKPIYPDSSLYYKDSIEALMSENARIWKEIYEREYSMPLEYTSKKA